MWLFFEATAINDHLGSFFREWKQLDLHTVAEQIDGDK